jgi:hypothetical protein
MSADEWAKVMNVPLKNVVVGSADGGTASVDLIFANGQTVSINGRLWQRSEGGKPFGYLTVTFR